MKTDQTTGKKNTLLLNIIFLAIIAIVITFLAIAPKETTSFLPHDDYHKDLFQIESKKEAEQFCGKCHSKDGVAPLPEQHPPKFRCLFCHKRK